MVNLLGNTHEHSPASTTIHITDEVQAVLPQPRELHQARDRLGYYSDCYRSVTAILQQSVAMMLELSQ